MEFYAVEICKRNDHEDNFDLVLCQDDDTIILSVYQLKSFIEIIQSYIDHTADKKIDWK